MTAMRVFKRFLESRHYSLEANHIGVNEIREFILFLQEISDIIRSFVHTKLKLFTNAVNRSISDQIVQLYSISVPTQEVYLLKPSCAYIRITTGIASKSKAI